VFSSIFIFFSLIYYILKYLILLENWNNHRIIYVIIIEI